ncbi:MAG: hypothetical protein GY940_32055 [bacterium]|nr:hypothetical protein [bacterium]
MKRRHLFMVLLIIAGSFLLTPELVAKVTRVRVSVKPSGFKGKCPKKFEFIGKIKSNRAGVVRYQWIRSDNATAPVKSITFKRRGTKIVKTTWTLGRSYRGWQALRILSPNKRVSNRAFFRLICTGKPLTVKPMIRQIKPLRVKPLKPIKTCPDPAATAIRFSIVSRTTQFRGRVRITGTVKNISSKAFRSAHNQGSVHLYEVPLGGSPVFRAKKDFANLAAGATIEVSYERNWNSSSPSEGEFPPNYRVQIVYDPDITLDGNKDNDDCSNANNRKERSGTGINSLFR